MISKNFTAEMTEIVMPGDTNHHQTLFGGRLMQWVDICAALAAQKCAGSVVTASVDALTFKKPVMLGDVVTLKSAVNRVWNSSMEIGVKVTGQSYIEKQTDNLGFPVYSVLGEERHVCSAYLTFVAIYDNNGKRRTIDSENHIVPVDDIWLDRWNKAEERRKLRLGK